MALAAGVGDLDAGIEQGVDEGLTARPAQAVPLAVQIDLDVRDF